MPKLVAGWVLGTHNFNYKSSSLFTRNKIYFNIINLYFIIFKLKKLNKDIKKKNNKNYYYN